MELCALREVIDGPLAEIAHRFSRALSGRWPHRALVIFTRECTGRPRKVAGAPELVDRITVEELDAIKAGMTSSDAHAGPAVLGGAQHWIWAVRDPCGTLLVLVPRARAELHDPAPLAAAFGIVATSIRQQVAQASPDYLAESRAASTERARTVAELTASHEAELTGILATLRSPTLDDPHARAAATDTASAALIAVRSRRAADRELAEEEPATAYERLRREIGPLLRHQRITADYAAPAADGRPIPGEVASGARALTRSVVLAFAGHSGVDRLRIAWSCENDVLIADIRDRAGAALDAPALRRNLAGRVHTLRANLDIEAVPGWATRVSIRFPLDPPATGGPEPQLAQVNRREREVLALVAAGRRNKAIAAELGIAESTVKFHVAALLKKLGVSSRGEAAALGMRAGMILDAAT